MLFVVAFDKTSGESVNAVGRAPCGETRLDEPDHYDSPFIVQPDGTSSSITVLGRPVDANGNVMVHFGRTEQPDVAPYDVHRGGTVLDWYSWQMNVVQGMPKAVRLTWSQHPGVNIPGDFVQTAFDTAADEVAADKDSYLNDQDPSLYQGDTSRLDHAPTYLEFFTPPSKDPTFPSPCDTENYKTLTLKSHADALVGAPFANVKIVHYMGFWDGGEFKEPIGWAAPYYNSFLILGSASRAAMLHEALHLLGLVHRDEYGDPPDEGALMNKAVDYPNGPGGWVQSGWELNRAEKSQAYAGSVQTLNW